MEHPEIAKKTEARRGGALQRAARAVWRQIDPSVDHLGTIAGFAFFLVSFLIVFDVVGRKRFGISSRATDEITGYVMAIAGTMAVLYGLKHGSHVRIDLLVRLMPKPARRLADWTAALAMAGFTAFWAARIWEVVRKSVNINAHATTEMATPLVIPQTLWALAASAAAFYAILLLTGETVRLVRGQERLQPERPKGWTDMETQA